MLLQIEQQVKSGKCNIELRDNQGNLLNLRDVIWFDTNSKLAKMYARTIFTKQNGMDTSKQGLFGSTNSPVTYYCSLHDVEAYNKLTDKLIK